MSTSEKDLFAFKVNYNTVENCTNYTGTALYNGNISETYWRTASDNAERKYGYKYDNLNRLREAIYQKPGLIPAQTLVTNAYDENITYDKNGNITGLKRKGNGDPQIGAMQIDDLTYVYMSNSSNQLLKVTDGLNGNDAEGFIDANKTDDFTYDANGNMTTDKNKNITQIIYNHLNLPIKITFGTTGTIEYLYDANGKKLEKLVTQGTVVTTTKYLEGFQYTNDVLQYFPTAEGYVSKTGSSYKYVFNYTDHLGNIRLSYAKNPTTGDLEILEENNYYPFGLKHNGYNSNNSQPNYKYKFQGQERQDELELNWDSFKWRNYDSAIGRFMRIDPLAEKFISESPYAYVNNDPLGYSDFDGKDYTIDITRDKDGNITGVSISGTVYIQGNGASQKRADELNKFAKDNLKTKSVDGVSVSIGVNYKYDNEKKEKELKQGENLLTFDSATEDNSNISHINSMEISQEGKKTKFLAGKTGTIYGSGQDNNTVFHESMHLLGLVDRYEDNRDKKWMPAELRGTIPDKGYEKNAMGNSSYTNLNQQQYRSWMEHAVSRSKANNNTNRIIGVLQVDRSIKTGQ